MAISRLHDVVDAGAAAAPGSFRQLDQFQVRDQAQQLARLRGDLLAVREVAGLVIGHLPGAGGTALRGRLDADLDQPFVDVLDLLVPERARSR